MDLPLSELGTRMRPASHKTTASTGYLEVAESRKVFPKDGARIRVTMQKGTFDRIMLQRQTGTLWLKADHYEESNPKRWFRLLRSLIRQGHNDPGLFANLANAYAEGQGTKPNRLQALRWNRKAWRRGSESAACNAGIDAIRDGRRTLAMIWFRRAIAMGNYDALLHLAKLLLQLGNRRAEAMSLLRKRIEIGPEQMFELRKPGETTRPVTDEDFAEAKRLLNEL